MVGSCCTLVAMRLLSDNKFKMPDEIALLLYGWRQISHTVIYPRSVQFLNCRLKENTTDRSDNVPVFQSASCATQCACRRLQERRLPTMRRSCPSSSVATPLSTARRPFSSSRKPSWTRPVRVCEVLNRKNITGCLLMFQYCDCIVYTILFQDSTPFTCFARI